MFRQSRFLNFTEDWLKRNHKRFRHSLVLIRYERGYLDYSFRGVSNMFLCTFQDNGAISIVIEFRGKVWDIPADFDVMTVRDSARGYYCRQCEIRTRKYYSSRELLWVRHSLEPLRAWTNRKLRSSIRLGLYQYNSSTWARLLTVHKSVYDPDRQCRVRIIRAVRPGGVRNFTG